MTTWLPASRARVALLSAAGLLSLGLLACTTGTPAAPEGTTIFATVQFVDGTRNFLTGDFEAILTARLLDDLSGVPQTGVQVNFFILEGLGEFLPDGSGDIQVRSDNDGRAQVLLSATGARTTDSQVTVHIVSGGAEAVDVSLTVRGSSTGSARPPVARFVVSPDAPTTSDTVRVDVSGSTDPDCPGGTPDDWRLEWGDDTSSSGTFDGSTTATHVYSRTGTFEILLEVTNCLGESDTTAQSITVS